MERLLSVVLLCCVAAVVGSEWWSIAPPRRPRTTADDRAELACLLRAQVTATIALLAPEENVDAQGRLGAMQTLGKQVDAC